MQISLKNVLENPLLEYEPFCGSSAIIKRFTYEMNLNWYVYWETGRLKEREREIESTASEHTQYGIPVAEQGLLASQTRNL